MVRSEGEKLKRVIVCTPEHEYAHASNLEKHNIGELGNPKIAIQQHDALKSKLSEFGTEVIDIPELPEHPNSVFTRDTALSTPSGLPDTILHLDKVLMTLGQEQLLYCREFVSDFTGLDWTLEEDVRDNWPKALLKK
ncbi:MAG: hypothetical protein B6230_02715 [Desulfobacteraceae bacterium 4572_89]|nr:MAG: hypothetical protein B6230_02715 [Desulfobacteraceae bacterium 4572_89]